MNFTSTPFVLFFTTITTLYYVCHPKWRWALLLVGSCYFYMAFLPKYILILFALIIIDFFLAKKIETSIGKKRKILFIVSIISNVGILFVFKYFNFFNDNMHNLANFIHWNYPIGSLSLILPLGLSFHTFQSLSYVIEVYKGKYKAERHLGIYALYVLFFPQLVAGPIERPEHLLPQLKTDHKFSWKNIQEGVRLMAWGFLKKLVIADRLALSVTYVYGHISSSSSLSILITIIFFTFQLYADFSGYSDIARGSAKALGIDVTRNFEQPYFSKSVAEFWRRWHISLSSWFRDYFYFPLVYSKHQVTKNWLYACIILTFIVTGLWHGAGWTFIIMGALHGIYIVTGTITKSWRDKTVATKMGVCLQKVRGPFQIIFTFALVSFSWIFFRSPNLSTAITFIKQLFINWNVPLNTISLQYIIKPFDTLGFSQTDLLISIVGIGIILFVEHFQNHKPIGVIFDEQSLFVRSVTYSSLFLVIFVFGIYTTSQFIYFQF